MPVDVVDALKTVLSQEGGMTDQKVEEYVKNLERERRFQTETWSWHWRPVGLLLLQLFLLMVNRFVDGNLLQALYSVYVCWMSVAEETAFACDEIVFFLVLMIKLIMIVTHYYPSSKKLMPSSETLPQGLRVHAYGACHVFRSSSCISDLSCDLHTGKAASLRCWVYCSASCVQHTFPARDTQQK